MNWKEKMSEWGGGEVSFLSEDGETMTFIVVDDPVLLEGKFKGRLTQRIGCPIVTQEGFSLLIIGKRVARRLSRYEDRFDDVALTITRHGEHGDIESTYELVICQDGDLTAKLFNWRDNELNMSAIPEAIEAAEAIVAG